LSDRLKEAEPRALPAAAAPPKATALRPEPVLRTLSPALRELEQHLREWLAREHRHPLATEARAALQTIGEDLRRKADALELDKPLLVVMLMGGTGVGKSTLLNALAGGPVASASFARPTTRDPVVYFHETVVSTRLDPALQHCRLAQHDRPALEQKILVDTPDLDSNDLANREKLHHLLPHADVVLYVGSQEKYHDRLGWDLFLEHRQRRAFAFVLNKWDRCIGRGGVGLRPDEDLLNDLKGEGFENPLIFRTCAQFWVDRADAKGNGSADAEGPPVEGEQFRELIQWLEHGLTRMEIEAIKTRGVGQLLTHLEETLDKVCPPDLSAFAQRTAAIWERTLRDEARADAQVLLDTLEPFQREVEHHFASQRQSHFRGIMGGYLQLFNKIKYAGSQLRERLPFVPRFGAAPVRETKLDLAEFTRACSIAASDRHLDARGRALANKLLLEADQQGFPLHYLTQPTEAAAKLDWRQRFSHALGDVLNKVQEQWARPKGPRRYLQGLIVLLSDWLPGLSFIVALAYLLWRFFNLDNSGYQVHLIDMLLPFAILLSVCVILHVFVAIVLPLRWQAIRDEFQRQLAVTLQTELLSLYGGIPQSVADELLAERRGVQQMIADTKEVQTWLDQREQASVTSLYGA
jgi:energy-coupling factor transporter ATP-binding protein EcfA2